MRLWHQSLIPYLDRQRLLGQHRECCALRGKGWGKPHTTVNYVFDHSYNDLYFYHSVVMSEMYKRKYYELDSQWFNVNYRGKNLTKDINNDYMSLYEYASQISSNDIIYPEHNYEYLVECIDNLRDKGAPVDYDTISRLEEKYIRESQH